ncbi:hypothetical protein Ctob_007323 [Chrysochromulina tobinii]|uniref:Uncharacterized protein n=1 Tax=Chrysochromulina tobinii TaxID=1460289 RepID=A0A0M0JTS5_9EUKA|nr:hypothetical protein Ctob_007323 [Chrysochromulina tobinii]|eukprot:KOO29752.1 hypothetical protein Ctob_007323 [Chrysochromulina sp. CCMP291]
MIDEADDVEVVHVRVQPHKVVRCVEQPYATYLISVTGESGLEWETERRWNDLRVLEESLQRSDGETLRTHAGSLPHFDAHGNLLVSLFVNKFDPSFLKERAEQMQALLNGWARVLKVRLDAPATGPADMLEFLSAGRPGEASTPRTPATLPPLKGFYDGDSSSGNKPKAKVGSSSPQPVRVLFDALDEEATEVATGQPGVGYYAFRNFLVFLFVFLLPSLVAFIKQKLISRTDGRVVEADFPAVDLLNLKF